MRSCYDVLLYGEAITTGDWLMLPCLCQNLSIELAALVCVKKDTVCVGNF